MAKHLEYMPDPGCVVQISIDNHSPISGKEREL